MYKNREMCVFQSNKFKFFYALRFVKTARIKYELKFNRSLCVCYVIEECFPAIEHSHALCDT